MEITSGRTFLKEICDFFKTRQKNLTDEILKMLESPYYNFKNTKDEALKLIQIFCSDLQIFNILVECLTSYFKNINEYNNKYFDTYLNLLKICNPLIDTIEKIKALIIRMGNFNEDDPNEYEFPDKFGDVIANIGIIHYDLKNDICLLSEEEIEISETAMKKNLNFDENQKVGNFLIDLIKKIIDLKPKVNIDELKNLREYINNIFKKKGFFHIDNELCDDYITITDKIKMEVSKYYNEQLPEDSKNIEENYQKYIKKCYENNPEEKKTPKKKKLIEIIMSKTSTELEKKIQAIEETVNTQKEEIKTLKEEIKTQKEEIKTHKEEIKTLNEKVSNFHEYMHKMEEHIKFMTNLKNAVLVREIINQILIKLCEKCGIDVNSSYTFIANNIEIQNFLKQIGWKTDIISKFESMKNKGNSMVHFPQTDISIEEAAIILQTCSESDSLGQQTYLQGLKELFVDANIFFDNIK
jgi:hypothetical protein